MGSSVRAAAVLYHGIILKNMPRPVSWITVQVTFGPVCTPSDVQSRTLSLATAFLFGFFVLLSKSVLFLKKKKKKKVVFFLLELKIFVPMRQKTDSLVFWFLLLNLVQNSALCVPSYLLTLNYGHIAEMVCTLGNKEKSYLWQTTLGMQ